MPDDLFDGENECDPRVKLEETTMVKGVFGGRHRQCLEGLMGPSEKGENGEEFCTRTRR